MNKQTTIADIGEAFKKVLDLVLGLPPTNAVLREKAIAAIQQAHRAADEYFVNQAAVSQLASDKPETEEERINRIVAPYIETVGGGKRLLGITYKGEISMKVKAAAAQKILAQQAAQNAGLKIASSATEGASEEGAGKKKSSQTAVQPPYTSTTQPSDSGEAQPAPPADPAVVREIGDLFTDGNIAGSLFGATVLGEDGGETAIKELEKAFQEIENTTSPASMQRGETKIADYAIALICWMLGIIETEDINIASPTGLHEFPAGRPLPENKRLTKKNLVEAMFSRLRPDLAAKGTHNKKTTKKTHATPPVDGDK